MKIIILHDRCDITNYYFNFKLKVFFRAGALALLEEKRDDIVTLLIRKMQGQIRGHIRRKDYNKRKQQR